MAVKKKVSKKKDPSWDQIGKQIGKKIEKTKWEKLTGRSACSTEPKCTGGFGRVLFIIALLAILNAKGFLAGISIWWLILLAIGFGLMKL